MTGIYEITATRHKDFKVVSETIWETLARLETVLVGADTGEVITITVVLEE